MPFWRNSTHSSQEIILFPQSLVFMKKKMHWIRFWFFYNLKPNYPCGSSTFWLQRKKSPIPNAIFSTRALCHLPSWLLREFIPFIIFLHVSITKHPSFLTPSYKFIKQTPSWKRKLNLPPILCNLQGKCYIYFKYCTQTYLCL